MVAERGPSDQRVKLVRRIASKIFIRRPIALRFAAHTAAQFANCENIHLQAHRPSLCRADCRTVRQLRFSARGIQEWIQRVPGPQALLFHIPCQVVLICRCKQVILIEYASRITVWNARACRHGESCKAAAERDAVLRPRRCLIEIRSTLRILPACQFPGDST